MAHKERTCNKCGWVAFGVTHEDAENEINRFNEMFEDLTASEKERYYGNRKASIDSYNKCRLCGNSHKDFRDAVDYDSPIGVTLSPILND